MSAPMFIQFTRYAPGSNWHLKPVVVNMGMVEAMYPDEHGTILSFMGEESFIIVEEALADIGAMKEWNRR